MSNATATDSRTRTPPAPAHHDDWALWMSVCFVAGANLLGVSGFRLPFLGPAVGFWFLVIHPAYLLYTTSLWRRASVAERLGYSVTAVLLLLMVAGLGINFLLPLVGVQRPLDPIPIVILGDTLTVLLYLLRRQYPAKLLWRTEISTIGRLESRLLVGAGLCVAFAVLGANRLNNGAGDQLGLLALAGLVAILVLLMLWRRQVREGLICVILYMVSLTLLLMTSLRGWYVTGHDIQTEYRVFQLTAAHGRWSISDFHNAYNACLSITILPTELSQILHVDGPYVYKLFFQLMFALCPALTYAISRRYWSRTIAIMSAVYFMGFPTFFSDMPFLNRQEIAYLFVCVGFLAITNIEWNLRWRRFALITASLGVELSHYSTMYLFLGTLITAWATRYLVDLIPSGWHRRDGAIQGDGKPWAAMNRTVSIGAIGVVAAIAFMWSGLATQTAGAVVTDAESGITGLFGHSNSAQAGDVSYGLVPTKLASPQSILNDYRLATLKVRSGSVPSTYISGSVVDRYPTPVVKESALPITSIGRSLSDLGVSPGTLNTLVRQVAAKGEQIFVGIGLIGFLAFRKDRRRIGSEFFCLCVGSVVTVAGITVLPALSVDYGVLRAFQEALIIIAPVLVVGSLSVFRVLGQVWGLRATKTVCIGLFVSTSGLLPQILGGYPAQLSLNNSGQYYDIYYTHPQEEAALSWLANKPGTLPAGVQAENFTDRFSFTNAADVTGQQVIADIYPPLVRESSWVILGYTNVHADLATADYDGNLITYRYPTSFLWDNKDLVYNNGGSEIYK
jgi:uncharacterized membrane protein